MTFSSAIAEAVLNESLLNKLFSPRHSPGSKTLKGFPSFVMVTFPFEIK